ncbi:MAG: site-specific integrase [Gaiellaceae bacterium]
MAPGVYVRDGKYEISYTDIEGRFRFKTLGPVRQPGSREGLTKRDALAAREKLRVAIRAGEAVAPSRAKLDEVASSFFEMFESLVAAGEKSERTLDLYRQRYRSHLERPLGRLRIQNLRAEHVARVLGELRRQGLSPWTITGVYTLLGTILNHAVTRGIINDSPLRRLSRTERPAGRNRTRARVLTEKEIEQLIDSTPESYRALVATAAYSGLRQSELLALRWCDVDFEEEVLFVRHQLSRATRAKPARLLPLKTDAGERTVILLPALHRMLRQHRETAFKRGHAQTDDFLFATLTGQPIYYRNASARGLDVAANRAGLNNPDQQKLSFHDLRHSFISHLIAGGIDVVVVQRQAGHARPSITLDRYSHEFANAQRAADLRARIAATGFGN